MVTCTVSYYGVMELGFLCFNLEQHQKMNKVNFELDGILDVISLETAIPKNALSYMLTKEFEIMSAFFDDMRSLKDSKTKLVNISQVVITQFWRNTKSLGYTDIYKIQYDWASNCIYPVYHADIKYKDMLEARQALNEYYLTCEKVDKEIYQDLISNDKLKKDIALQYKEMISNIEETKNILVN